MKRKIETREAEDAPYEYRDRELDPDRKLLIAVLEMAFLDASIAYGDYMIGISGNRHQRSQRSQRVCEEAKRWLYSKDTHTWSFRWICEHLDFVPQYILKAINTPESQSRINKSLRSGRSRPRAFWQKKKGE